MDAKSSVPRDLIGLTGHYAKCKHFDRPTPSHFNLDKKNENKKIEDIANQRLKPHR